MASRSIAPDNLTSQRPPGSFPVRVSGAASSPRERVTGRPTQKGLSVSWPSRSACIRSATVRCIVACFRRFCSVIHQQHLGRHLMTGFSEDKVYVVQTISKIVDRCILMATDPGDLVLDPTCGSGTTAYVAEQWGRRWITIDTSRVALALARTRLMAARYPWYLLADSREGRAKEAALARRLPARDADPQRYAPRLRLRASAARHAQSHRQQPADRRHLGEMAGGAGATARRAQRRAWQIL